MLKKIFITGVFLAQFSMLHAAPVLTVTANTGFGASADALLKSSLESEINKQFQVLTVTDFLKAMSNAQAVTNKGQGVSYATEHTLFVAGGSLGAGLNTTSGFDFKTSGGLPPIGFGAQASAMLGISLASFPLPELGPIDPKRLTIFINYMGFEFNDVVDSLEIKTSTFGLHAQYKLLDGINFAGLGFFNWGGVLLTTGLDVSSNTLTYKIGQKINVQSSGQTYTWTPNSSSTLILDASAFSIPIEASTSVRVLYLLSVFGGIGIDLNMGESSMKANLNGPITDSGNVQRGSASLTMDESKGPSFGDVRFFTGFQVNLVPLKNTNILSLYAQVNTSVSGNYGLHAGARIAW